METYIRSEQTESFPQGGEIQNGDTGNHQDIPPTRGVGHVNRLQRRLLPYPHTGTVQKISEISCPGSNIPIQGSAFRSVNSTLGVHCSSKGAKTDGHTQGYKNPPVPRRLVSESHIPPGLSPAHPRSSTNLSRTRLASEFGQIGTGTKANLRFCRLSVRPQGRSGPTDSGPVAKPPGQNTGSIVSTDLSGPAIHVPDRFTDSHRKASSLRSAAYEAYTVASQKQLQDTGVTRKGYSNSQVPAPSLTMVARRQCPHRPTITPNKTCSANLYRHIKRRVGRSLKPTHDKRGLVTTRKQAAYKLSGAKSSLPSLERVSRHLCRTNSSGGNRKHYSSVIHKEGGMRSGPLCALLWRTLIWCTRNQVTLKAHHIPGRLNVIADKLSRLGQTIQTEWSLLQEVFQATCSRWHRPQIDLFATRFNNKLPLFVSPVLDPLASAVDALTLPWEDLDAYAFLGQSGGEITGHAMQENHSDCPRVAQHALVLGPSGHVQPDPTKSAQPAQPVNTTIKSDPSQKSDKPKSPCMAPRATAIKEQGLSEAVAARIEAPQRRSTRSVYQAKWTIFTKWCSSDQVDFRAPPVKSVAD